MSSPDKRRPNDFEEEVRKIADFFRQYSIYDIASSLFALSLWVPNNSSPIKTLLWSTIFVSMNEKEFIPSNRINSYEDFSKFAEGLMHLTAADPMHEDFISQHDWGDVRYYLGGKMYQIFYGNDPECAYDWLGQFQLTHAALDEAYKKLTTKSPAKEMGEMLQFQDAVIGGLKNQSNNFDIATVDLGHIETPAKKFWEEAMAFFSAYEPEQHFSPQTISDYAVKFGSGVEHLKGGAFFDALSESALLPGIFLDWNSKHLLLLPRRSTELLIQRWKILYAKHKESLEKEIGEPISQLVARGLNEYMRYRLGDHDAFKNVRAVTKEGKIHPFVCSNVLVIHNEVIILHVIDPVIPEVPTDLQALGKQLSEVIPLFQGQSLKLFLNDERDGKEARLSEGEFHISAAVIVPFTSLQPARFDLEGVPGHLISLNDILGIIDEIKDGTELPPFFKFLDEYERKMLPHNSPLDKYAAFQQSHGVIEEGAVEYNLISADPHGGSRLRFESLRDFWKIYPHDHLFEHPETWEPCDPRLWHLDPKSAKCISVVNRGGTERTINYFLKIGRKKIVMTAPFSEIERTHSTTIQQIRFLSNCIEDALIQNEDVIQSHQFFSEEGQLDIVIFPLSFLEGRSEYADYLKELDPRPKGLPWAIDVSYMPERKAHLMRIVSDDERVYETFENVTDASSEIALILDIVKALDTIDPDPGFEKLEKQLEAQRNKLPRFKMGKKQKPASFPQHVKPHLPENKHYKIARKRIAELAKKEGIEPGNYKGDVAKKKLNDLKKVVVNEINTQVTKFDFAKALPVVISSMDALTCEREMDRMELDMSKQHEVDFDRAERHREIEKKFTDSHRDFRYLTEKLVQLEPKGSDVFTVEKMQELIAFVHWLHNIQGASDGLHYGVLPLSVEITDQYLVDPLYEGLDEKEKKYEQQEMELIQRLAPKDEGDSANPAEPSWKKAMDEMDAAFRKDLGFSHTNMMEILVILASWPEHIDREESTCYFATADEIREAYLNNPKVRGTVADDEIQKILDFLTLRRAELLKKPGRADLEDDLPIWEHKKRPMRYMLHPLIPVDGKYCWGPYSAKKTCEVWYSFLFTGLMPYEMEGTNIKQFLHHENQKTEKDLALQAKKIVESSSSFTDGEVFLHKKDPAGNHPLDLGDYDVISFLSEKNIILNIECKEIRPAYCLKDARTQRDTIFGDDRKPEDQGHFEQINKREKYLQDNFEKIGKIVSPNWKIDPANPPKIVTVYLTRHDCWWTKFPPSHVTAKFVRLGKLDEFLKNL